MQEFLNESAKSWVAELKSSTSIRYSTTTKSWGRLGTGLDLAHKTFHNRPSLEDNEQNLLTKVALAELDGKL